MRYFFTLIFGCSIFLFCILFGVGGNLQGNGLHEFYLYNPSSNCKIVRLSEKESFNFIYLKSNLKGECVILENRRQAELTLKKYFAVKVLEEHGENFYCEYYYSPLISSYIYIKDKKINLHLSETNGQIKLGSPIIFGGF